MSEIEAAAALLREHGYTVDPPVPEYDRAVIADELERAWSPPAPGTALDSGWEAAANLVIFWLRHPNRVPVKRREQS